MGNRTPRSHTSADIQSSGKVDEKDKEQQCGMYETWLRRKDQTVDLALATVRLDDLHNIHQHCPPGQVDSSLFLNQVARMAKKRTVKLPDLDDVLEKGQKRFTGRQNSILESRYQTTAHWLEDRRATVAKDDPQRLVHIGDKVLDTVYDVYITEARHHRRRSTNALPDSYVELFAQAGLAPTLANVELFVHDATAAVVAKELHKDLSPLKKSFARKIRKSVCVHDPRALDKIVNHVPISKTGLLSMPVIETPLTCTMEGPEFPTRHSGRIGTKEKGSVDYGHGRSIDTEMYKRKKEETAIINSTVRVTSVISRERMQLLAVDAETFLEIFIEPHKHMGYCKVFRKLDWKDKDYDTSIAESPWLWDQLGAGGNSIGGDAGALVDLLPEADRKKASPNRDTQYLELASEHVQYIEKRTPQGNRVMFPLTKPITIRDLTEPRTLRLPPGKRKFIPIHTLRETDVFGLDQVPIQLKRRQSRSVILVSLGAECIALHKGLFCRHASRWTQEVVQHKAFIYNDDTLRRRLSENVNRDVHLEAVLDNYFRKLDLGS
nr:hypothetical protein BaRGS_009513 [Batillaria attramentaria]